MASWPCSYFRKGNRKGIIRFGEQLVNEEIYGDIHAEDIKEKRHVRSIREEPRVKYTGGEKDGRQRRSIKDK